MTIAITHQVMHGLSIGTFTFDLDQSIGQGQSRAHFDNEYL